MSKNGSDDNKNKTGTNDNTSTNDNKVNKIHNYLFGWMMSEPDNVVSVMKNVIPKEVSQKLDFSTVKRANGVISNENLTESQVDALFEVEYKSGDVTKEVEKALVDFLVEHKSYLDKNSVLQTFIYFAMILAEQLKKGGKKFTRIIPVVFHHGDKPVPEKYKHLSCIFDGNSCFDAFTPKFSPVYIDLNEMQREDIKGNDKYKITMLTMKYSHKHVKDYHKDMDIILNNLSVSVQDAHFKKYIGVVIFYAYYVRKGNVEEQNRIVELGHRLGCDVRGKTMSLMELIADYEVEQMQQESYAKGEKKGKKENALKMAGKMKDRGYPKDVILELTELTEEDIDQL